MSSRKRLRLWRYWQKRSARRAAAQVVLNTRCGEELLDVRVDIGRFRGGEERRLRSAASLAAKSGDAGIARQMRQRLAEIDQIKKEYVKAAPSRDTLRTKPDDPEANYVWGYYLGPSKGDFEHGLPYLAKGNEKSPAEMAKKELAQPTDPKAQASLADAWLDFSNNEREPARSHLPFACRRVVFAGGWEADRAGKEARRGSTGEARAAGRDHERPTDGKNFIKYLDRGELGRLTAGLPTRLPRMPVREPVVQYASR